MFFVEGDVRKLSLHFYCYCCHCRSAGRSIERDDHHVHYYRSSHQNNNHHHHHDHPHYYCHHHRCFLLANTADSVSAAETAAVEAVNRFLSLSLSLSLCSFCYFSSFSSFPCLLDFLLLLLLLLFFPFIITIIIISTFTSTTSTSTSSAPAATTASAVNVFSCAVVLHLRLNICLFDGSGNMVCSPKISHWQSAPDRAAETRAAADRHRRPH